jgi:hypothetical protein
MSNMFPAAPRIALTVDNPYRDLAGLVLVAWRLCQAGATCFLVPMNLQGAEIWPLMPDFVLLNYLRTNNEELARYMMEVGIQVGVLDTEGGIFSPIDQWFRTERRRNARTSGAVLSLYGRRFSGTAPGRLLLRVEFTVRRIRQQGRLVSRTANHCDQHAPV